MYRTTKHVLACTASHCTSKGANDVLMLLRREVMKRGLDKEILVNNCGTIDLCDIGPNIVVYPDNVIYSGVTKADVPELVAALANNAVLERLVLNADTPAERARHDFYAAAVAGVTHDAGGSLHRPCRRAWPGRRLDRRAAAPRLHRAQAGHRRSPGDDHGDEQGAHAVRGVTDGVLALWPHPVRASTAKTPYQCPYLLLSTAPDRSGTLEECHSRTATCLDWPCPTMARVRYLRTCRCRSKAHRSYRGRRCLCPVSARIHVPWPSLVTHAAPC